MRVEDFTADADLVGGRVRVRWRLVAEGDESITGEPPLRLLGKERDFEFGPETDDDLLYHSERYPPSATRTLNVVEHRRPSERRGDRRVHVDVVTVAEFDAEAGPDRAVPDIDEQPDGWTEVSRRTRSTVVAPDGRVVEREDEILDLGGGGGLSPHVARYYELRGPLVPADRPLRAMATPGAAHRSGRYLYDLLPSVWRRHDVPPASVGPSTGRIGAIPESRVDAGQLRRFFDLFGVAADHLRSRAEELRLLHDVEHVESRMLPHLAHLIGWELSPESPIPLQRHEIRYAARLYRLTGTIPGVKLWAKRLSSWDVDVKEFAENVLWSNDPGGEDGATRSGSFSVDTADAELLSSMGTARDAGDYTYDTGSGPDDRYSPHTIGIFATPDDGDRAGDVATKRDRLVAAADRYVPANLRVVVVLPDDPVESESDVVLGVSGAAEVDL